MNRKMKGIGVLPFLILSMIGVVSFTTGLAYIKSDFSSQAFSENPWQIIVDAMVHFPTKEFYDLFFGGIAGVLQWFNNFLLIPFLSLPFLNRIPPFIGYLIILLIISFGVWRKKEAIYDFVTRYTIYFFVFGFVVISIGVVLKFMNLV